MPARSRTIIRIEAIYRLARLRYLSRILPTILVTEYPKSGASWLAQMLSDTTGYDFPRQRFPGLRPSIFHGHYLFDKISTPTIVFWRDPRDIMISWYHHCMFKTDKNNHDLVDQISNYLGFSDVEDVAANLPKFIDYSFTASFSPRFSFNDFFDTWHDRDDVIYSSYEKLQVDTAGELLRISKRLGTTDFDSETIGAIVHKHSFSNQSARSPGTELKSHYLRKGIVGDWKNYFTPESAQVLNQFLETRLNLLGYEEDDSWMQPDC